nr:PREDICTED: putative odorant-binding protein A5 [Bemisia tabaci]
MNDLNEGMFMEWGLPRMSVVFFVVVSFIMCAICRALDDHADATTTSTIHETTKRISDIYKPRGELTADLLRHEIIPDCVYDVPTIVCTVEWVNGKFASLGNLIPIDVVNSPPHWIDFKGNETEWYTLIMAGLDVPSHMTPTLREYLHWLVVNIPGNEIKEGQELASYNVPAPAEDTGIHRHVIVVYKQPKKLAFDEKPIRSSFADDRRANFSNCHFAEKYHFSEFQSPVAINFFQTEWTPKTTVSSSLLSTTHPTTFTSQAADNL